MRVRTHNPVNFIFACSMAVLSACVPQHEPDQRVVRPTSADVITESDIRDSQASTVYDAILRKRPMFLMSRVDLAPRSGRQVYLNGILLGGLIELRSIPAREVSEIRFVRVTDAGANGMGRPGGAILVVSKSSR